MAARHPAQPDRGGARRRVRSARPRSLGRDPAQGSSVMLTFVTDGMGFFLFLGLARLFLVQELTSATLEGAELRAILRRMHARARHSAASVLAVLVPSVLRRCSCCSSCSCRSPLLSPRPGRRRASPRRRRSSGFNFGDDYQLANYTADRRLLAQAGRANPIASSSRRSARPPRDGRT